MSISISSILKLSVTILFPLSLSVATAQNLPGLILGRGVTDVSHNPKTANRSFLEFDSTFISGIRLAPAGKKNNAQYITTQVDNKKYKPNDLTAYALKNGTTYYSSVIPGMKEKVFLERLVYDDSSKWILFYYKDDNSEKYIIHTNTEQFELSANHLDQDRIKLRELMTAYPTKENLIWNYRYNRMSMSHLVKYFNERKTELFPSSGLYLVTGLRSTSLIRNLDNSNTSAYKSHIPFVGVSWDQHIFNGQFYLSYSSDLSKLRFSNRYESDLSTTLFAINTLVMRNSLLGKVIIPVENLKPYICIGYYMSNSLYSNNDLVDIKIENNVLTVYERVNDDAFDNMTHGPTLGAGYIFYFKKLRLGMEVIKSSSNKSDAVFRLKSTEINLKFSTKK
ncbi:MAG: hypothetical protein JXQ90_13805 [Cyclobacteriaceae bacterium]